MSDIFEIFKQGNIEEVKKWILNPKNDVNIW